MEYENRNIPVPIVEHVTFYLVNPPKVISFQDYKSICLEQIKIDNFCESLYHVENENLRVIVIQDILCRIILNLTQNRINV